MAQHLWSETPEFRLCEVCLTWQLKISSRSEWTPDVTPICRRDDDGRRRPQLKPNTPSGAPRELEVA